MTIPTVNQILTTRSIPAAVVKANNDFLFAAIKATDSRSLRRYFLTQMM